MAEKSYSIVCVDPDEKKHSVKYTEENSKSDQYPKQFYVPKDWLPPAKKIRITFEVIE